MTTSTVHDGRLDSIAQTPTVQFPTQREFRFGVTLPLSLHSARSGLAGGAGHGCHIVEKR